LDPGGGNIVSHQSPLHRSWGDKIFYEPGSQWPEALVSFVDRRKEFCHKPSGIVYNLRTKYRKATTEAEIMRKTRKQVKKRAN
jgi:hypothetical protein